MKRILACGVLICGLPLLATTYEYGTCRITITGRGTFWQKIVALWTVNYGDCGMN
jgi:hypothetical protein